MRPSSTVGPEKRLSSKRAGKGFRCLLTSSPCHPRPGNPSVLLQAECDSKEASHWALKGFIPADGNVVALAAEGNEWHSKFWLWPSKNPTEGPFC